MFSLIDTGNNAVAPSMADDPKASGAVEPASFVEPPQADVDFRNVADDSRTLVLQMMDMELAKRFPETSQKDCQECTNANNLAWDILLWRVGGRKKPQAGKPQVCNAHKRIKLGHRIAVARRLDKNLMTLIPEPKLLGEADPVIAIVPQNGDTFDHVTLRSGRRIVEHDDRYPQVDTLCDFGHRAQKAEAFYETWMLEVKATHAAKCGHRGKPHVRTPP